MEAIGEFFKGASIGAACGAVGTIVASAATSIVGFTSSGVAAGSLAAGLQASVGNVAAGSLFAGMQTIGATGAIIGALPAVAITTGIATGIYLILP